MADLTPEERAGLRLSAEPWWWHALHGLHDQEHHLAHRPMDACVPLRAVAPDGDLEAVDPDRLAALLQRHDKLQGFAKWARDVLGDDCRYDHHGLCQTHFLDEKPCPMEALAALDREDRPSRPGWPGLEYGAPPPPLLDPGSAT